MRTMISLLVVSMVFVGCAGSDGPPLGEVSGVVTLDGKPASFASLTFIPVVPGRQSTAVANENGEYTLDYSQTKTGAIVGEHGVIIATGVQTPTDGEFVDDPRKLKPGVKIPAKYSDKSLNQVSVKKGSNTLNFELTSG